MVLNWLIFREILMFNYMIVIFELVLMFLFFLFSVYYFIQYVYQKKYILNYLGSIVDVKSKSSPVNNLSLLLELLKKKITYVGLSKYSKRPLLRHSAFQTLKLGKGFCGENSRVVINALYLMGIKCNRVYMVGEKWGHVLTECYINGNWYIFDAHNDPKTFMSKEQIGKIKTEDFHLLHNDYEENTWVDFERIKIAPSIFGLNKVRLPYPLVIVVENPTLIKAILFNLLFFISLSLFLFN